VNLIERVVLDMESSWTPTGALEVGIEGYIELFDPATRKPLGLTPRHKARSPRHSPEPRARLVRLE